MRLTPCSTSYRLWILRSPMRRSVSTCSLPDSWDNLVVAIGSNTTTLALEDVVASMLWEEMRRKNTEGSNKDALVVRDRPIDRDKGRFSGRMFKSKGRSKSSVQST
jgi:hypothetical protein